MIKFGILWTFITILADWMIKRWALPDIALRRTHDYLLVIAGCGYVVNAMLWILMVSDGLEMSRGSVIFSCLGLIAGVVIGIALGEHFSPINWAGFVLACVAIIFMYL